VKVLFFARLREALGASSMQLPPEAQPGTVGELRQWLRGCEQAELAEIMADANVFCAVNQRVVDDEQPLRESDEIAFYPPVTGG
jgi:molybdopterin synthase sulfur carrier subunit